jgi:hypothetical protein
MDENKYAKWTIDGDKKQSGFVVVFKQQIIILNSVMHTTKLYKKQFKLKLMNWI